MQPLACRIWRSGESPKLAEFRNERRGKGSRSCAVKGISLPPLA
jgi:hypothetical protein